MSWPFSCFVCTGRPLALWSAALYRRFCFSFFEGAVQQEKQKRR
jgi:hypothetical protein